MYSYTKNIQTLYSFIVYVKTGDIYKDIAEDIETRFHTSNHEINRPLPRGKITKKFVGLRSKTYSYLIDDGSGDKKAQKSLS